MFGQKCLDIGHLQMFFQSRFILRESGLIRQVDRGNSRAATLRRKDIEHRFPGLLGLLLADAE